MSDYQDIRGTRIKYLTSDPTLESSYEGQVWYNSTTGVNKTLVKFKAWATGGNVSAGRTSLGGSGTQTSSLIFGGNPPTSDSYTNLTEEYDGYAWSSGGNLALARANMGSAGTVSAGLASGGQSAPTTFTANVEEYDGSSWSEQNNLSTPGARRGCGTQTAGLVFGGTQAPPVLDATEEYDGTNWTNGGSMNVARNQLTGCGIQTSALAISGGTTPAAGTGAVEQYDGTSWTTVNSIVTTRYDMGSSAANADSALGFGGFVPPSTSSSATEEWDGTNWSTSPASLGTARYGMAGSGTSALALSTSGRNPGGRPTQSEEYSSATTQVGAGVWGTGGNLSTARGSFNTSYGTQTAGLATCGERTPGGSMGTEVEEYGGASWTSGGNAPTATGNMGGGGPQTAAIMMGGNTPGDNRVKTNYDYDGSSWTANPNMPQDSGATRGFGTQTAAICVGGMNNPGNTYHNKTMEFNGSSWSDGGDYPVNNSPNQGVINLMGFGTQTAALCAGGNHGNGAGNSNQLKTNSYDGSSWSAESDLGSLALFGGSFGTQGGGLISGYAPPPVGLTTSQRWDGSGWSSAAANNYGSQGKAGGGDLASGLIIGGIFSPHGGPNWAEIAYTEEWTGESTVAAAASTLTTS
tara:strand:- start:196 stop:2097 length:1902 start_codon:yes stop_codon:yes gene_type:complete